MSIWRYLTSSWDLHQLAAIEDMEARARRNRRAQRRDEGVLRQRIEALEQVVGRLMLVNQTLVEELTRLGSLQPDEFKRSMDAIDASDGVLDGKLTPPAPSPTVTPQKPPTAAALRRRRPRR